MLLKELLSPEFGELVFSIHTHGNDLDVNAVVEIQRIYLLAHPHLEIAAQIILNDEIKDIYTYPGYEGQQFINPRDAAVHSIDGTNSNGQTVRYYYDKNWHFLFYEELPAPETMSVWKVLATFTNKLFRVFDFNLFS